jgi:hypothetical protein
MKVSINNKILKTHLTKYKPYLSRRDLGKIIEEAIPNKEFNKITEAYLMKKYSVDKISDVVTKSTSKSVSIKKIMQALKISKSRLYFKLNFLKKYSNKIGLVIKKGRILKNTSKVNV